MGSDEGLPDQPIEEASGVQAAGEKSASPVLKLHFPFSARSPFLSLPFPLLPSLSKCLSRDRSTNKDLKVLKSLQLFTFSMATVNIDILGINELKWTGSDGLYSLQPKMEKLYKVSKNKTGSRLWLRS